MSKENVLFKTAGRLGIQNSAVLQKAEEFLRVFQAKGTIKSLNDVAKTVLCLDISSYHLGYQIDEDSAIKLSGLKKSTYFTNLHNIENILGLYKSVTISNLCVQFNCTDVKELAEEILSKYMSNLKNSNTHPQYVAAAVYVASKSVGIKSDQSQFVRISRIKPSQWKSLITEFKSVGNSLKNRKKQNSEEIAENFRQKNLNDPSDDITTSINESEEGYEEWKYRILKEAYGALKLKYPEDL